MNAGTGRARWRMWLAWVAGAGFVLPVVLWLQERMEVFYTPARHVLGPGVTPEVAESLERYIRTRHNFGSIRRPLEFNGGDFLQLLDPRNGPGRNHLKFEKQGNGYVVEIDRTSGGKSGSKSVVWLREDGKGSWIWQRGTSADY